MYKCICTHTYKYKCIYIYVGIPEICPLFFASHTPSEPGGNVRYGKRALSTNSFKTSYCKLRDAAVAHRICKAYAPAGATVTCPTSWKNLTSLCA